MSTSNLNEEGRIRELIGDWEKKVGAKDVDGIMSAYAPDILSFDAISELQFKGAHAYRKHWETCLSYCQGEFIFEIHDLKIAAGDDLAFSHSLCRCGGSSEDGNQQDGYMRVTNCYRKINGKWLIVHEHFSAPFDVETGKALLGLKP